MNMLLIDGVKYYLWTPEKEEEEFHPIIKEHSKEIFGKNSLYLPIEEFLVSQAGRGAMIDGIAIVFSERPEMYVVEVELSSHDLDKHIVEQINRFVRALKNPDNKKRITDDLEEKIRSNPMDEAFVKQEIGTREIYKFISDLVEQPPKIVIIIENKDAKLIEACENLVVSPIIKEFKTFVREGAPTVHAHLFEPLYVIEKISGKVGKEEGKRPLPEHYKSWEKMLAWVDDSTRDLVKELMTQVSSLGEVNHKPSGTDYCFYKGKPSSKSIFAALLLRKSSVAVRIRTDPTTFKDSKNWVSDKIYKGWFFKQGQERTFDLKEKGQIPYAIELIKQSYDLAK